MAEQSGTILDTVLGTVFNPITTGVAGITGILGDTTRSAIAQPTGLVSSSPIITNAGNWPPPDGPYAQASKYCLPSVSSIQATDTPCHGAQELYAVCAVSFYPNSPQDQQSCFCSEDSGQGYMYFEYLQGCSDCFRLHGSSGGYGAFGPNFVSLFSSAYCGQNNPTIGLSNFAGSFERVEQVTITQDGSTTNLLGTATDVNLYFTTHLVGYYATSSPNASSGLPTSSKIGIAVGVIAGVFLILMILGGFLLRRHRRKKVKSTSQYRKVSTMSKTRFPVDREPGIAVEHEPGIAVSR